MAYEVTVTYTKPIIRRAAGHFWRKYIAWHGFAVFALAFALLIGLLAMGDRSWATGGLLVVCVMAVVMSAMLYVVFLRRSLWKVDLMNSKSVVFTFSDHAMTTSSDLGKSELAWRGIEQIWKFPDVWLLFVAHTLFVTLPITQVDPEIQDFIAAQVVKHGGRVG